MYICTVISNAGTGPISFWIKINETRLCLNDKHQSNRESTVLLTSVSNEQVYKMAGFVIARKRYKAAVVDAFVFC